MFFRKQKAVGNDNRRAPDVPTHIGADSVIDGNVTVEGEIRIEGSIRGLVKAQVCVILPGGSVEGEVDAEDVVVHGTVLGPLRATHVHLQNGASVEGDITSDTIAIDTGARLSGAVWQKSRRQEPAVPAKSSSYDLPPPALFSEPLWDERQDEYRPLKAVRPRLTGGMRN